MGRKRWWKGGLELLVLCFFQTVVKSDGDVGCLFSKNVCRSEMESCYDDLAFGRCVRSFVDEIDDDDVYRYDLDAGELELLRERLQDLVMGGYDWSHPYTQCVMQSSLYSLRYGLKDEPEFCRDLRNINNPRFVVYEQNEQSREDSEPLAVVNFTPTRGHGYGDFADEKYYPPVTSSQKSNHDRSFLNDDNEDDYNYSRSPNRKKSSRQRINKLDDVIPNDDDHPIDDDSLPIDVPIVSNYVESPSYLSSSNNFRELAQRLNVRDDQPIYRLRRQQQQQQQQHQQRRQNDESVFGNYDETFEKMLDRENLKKQLSRNDDREIDNFERDNRQWNSNFNDYVWKLTKNGLSLGNKSFTIDNVDDVDGLDFLGNRDDIDDRWMRIGGDDDNEEVEEEEEQEMVDDDESETRRLTLENGGSPDRNFENRGIYTEGGLVRPIDIRDAIRQVSVPDDIVFDDDLLLWSPDLPAFQRNERLDVKKPGPLFSTNNYAFKTHSPISQSSNDDPITDDNPEIDQIPRSPLTKKKFSNDDDDNAAGDNDGSKRNYENVDLDHVYIEFDDDFKNWDDGEKVVEEVAKLLGYDTNVFTGVRVGRAEVTFKVNGDSPNDARGTAPKIYGIREELRKKTGRMLRCAGVGDKVKLPPSVEVEMAPKTMSTGVFGAIVAAGGAAAAAAAIVTLVIARKHAKSRAKLAGLATPDPEASKDYQDLCRARMQAKQPNEKPESPRIISLSRESESNRSSTSSWGEEAAALTNMDIATGHMVLSYMEDHLKNKDRLDQEWAGICAYEADPSSIAIATDKTNVDRNRPGSALPYNHSRIVLNDLSNASNSDYINASTITDHDPRNPAYIATQGPLPQTSADFWQLVWEQGSVVIVMLTRLTEEGRGMCHRYWPEEGSELYHIYEVHLVSEHIWCDDYLVRSFYLKNLRTGETRTVTQFHFLSWPENGVPMSTKALLEFRRKVNKSYRGRSCPIVVHCSDGAGRTGTYCLIDMVLNRMAKGAKEIDIAAALEHIRDQRPGMVATKQQFEFVLGAVAEEVHAILKALPVQTIADKTQTNGSNPTVVAQSSSGSDQ